MKKFLVIASLSFIVISCGNQSNDTSGDSSSGKGSDNNSGSLITSADKAKGSDLIAKSDCLGCHKINEKLIGPAYEAVAARYAVTAEVIDTLSQKIIQGGAGRWGQIPMQGHPQLSKEDAESMAKYVMSLKK